MAHAGQNHRQSARSVDFVPPNERAHPPTDGKSFPRALMCAHPRRCHLSCLQHHVKITRSDQRATRRRGSPETHSRTGNGDFARETGCQHRGENCAACAARSAKERETLPATSADTSQSIRSSGRHSDHHDLYLGQKSEAKSERSRVGSALCLAPGKLVLHLGQVAKCTNLRDQFAGDGFESGRAVDVAGLGDVVRSAEARASSVIEAPRSVSVLNMMMGTRGSILRNSRTVSSPSISGISNIEKNDVRFQRRRILPAPPPIHRRCRDFEIWILCQARDRHLRTTTASSTSSTRFLLATSLRSLFRIALLSACVGGMLLRGACARCAALAASVDHLELPDQSMQLRGHLGQMLRRLQRLLSARWCSAQLSPRPECSA